MIKYFTISEVVDPLSHHLFRDYDSEDTVKIDFVLRNRINSQIELNTTSDSCGIYLIKEIYNQLCVKFEHEPRKNTQIWSYIQQFEKYGLISVNTISKKKLYE